MLRTFCQRLSRSVNPQHYGLRAPHVLGTTHVRNFPICTVQTNLTDSQIPAGFDAKLTQFIANILGKDQQLVSVVVEPGARMWRGTDGSPTALVQMWSINVFDEEKNKVYTKPLYDFLLENLKIPSERIAVLLHPIQAHDAAHLIYAQMKDK